LYSILFYVVFISVSQ